MYFTRLGTDLVPSVRGEVCSYRDMHTKKTVKEYDWTTMSRLDNVACGRRIFCLWAWRLPLRQLSASSGILGNAVPGGTPLQQHRVPRCNTGYPGTGRLPLKESQRPGPRPLLALTSVVTTVPAPSRSPALQQGCKFVLTKLHRNGHGRIASLGRNSYLN
eukprot:2781402-Rhodomonas_salina.1